MSRTFGQIFEESGFYWEWVVGVWVLRTAEGKAIGQVHCLDWKPRNRWQAVTRNGQSMCYATRDGAKLGLVAVMDATLRSEAKEKEAKA